jgi:hypothetical protein
VWRGVAAAAVVVVVGVVVVREGYGVVHTR